MELLRLFLEHRDSIAESIEAVLNALRKPARYAQGPSPLSRQIDDCFLTRAAGRPRLRSQLEEAHWAAGFKPRGVHHLHNDLIDPAELMMRAVHCWQQTRWPGRNGRMHYAHTLFNLYVLRYLQFLSMRLWDENPATAGARLTEIQDLLDEVWSSSPPGQPTLVRDARWLIPLAQSLITDELAPYFEIAQRVTDTLPEADVLEIQKAHVRMLGGHLTSQIRYYCTKDGLSINERSVVLRTRASNALDLALLVQGLVGLLNAYDRALQSGDERARLGLAGAICQGISPDPELFVNRVDLLSAYSMIEHVFIATDSEGNVVYSPQGQRHVRLLKEYAVLLDRLIPLLRDDLPRFRPVTGSCSPYGVVFGLPSTLIEHMALKALQHDAETRFSLEDVFDDGGPRAEKLAWVDGWRELPHIPREVQRLYDYPQQFAEDIFHRIELELTRRDAIPRAGRLHVGDDAPESMKAEGYDQAHLLRDRQEAHFLVSYETPGGWLALKKDLLTEVLGAGRDAWIAGLPSNAARVLRLMCADLMSADSSG